MSAVLRKLPIGLAWSAANLALFISNGRIGVAASFPISQASIAISCVDSILMFREQKSSREWLGLLAGIAVMMMGVGLIGML